MGLKKILLISWHPGHKYVTAGGFVRNREIIKRLPNKSEFIVIDKYPSIYKDLLDISQFYEYKIPEFLQSLETRFYSLERVLEWLLSIVLILKIGVKVCRNQPISLIYAPCSEILVISVPSVILRTLKHKKLVFCNYNVRAVALLTKIVLSISTFIHNQADYIISLSESLKHDQQKAGIKPPIIVNTVGLDLEPFKKYLEEHDEPPKLYDMILVARLVKEKGLYDLPKILALVKNAGFSFRVVVVGEGSAKVKEDVLNELRTLGLIETVVFAGAISESEKIKLYYESEICVFPSYVEGWGIVPQEAMACGLPVVAYALDVYKENIAISPSVFQVELGDTQRFAEVVIELLKMGEEALAQLGEKGRPVVQNFDWEKVALKEFEILSCAIEA